MSYEFLNSVMLYLMTWSAAETVQLNGTTISE